MNKEALINKIEAEIWRQDDYEDGSFTQGYVCGLRAAIQILGEHESNYTEQSNKEEKVNINEMRAYKNKYQKVFKRFNNIFKKLEK